MGRLLHSATFAGTQVGTLSQPRDKMLFPYPSFLVTTLPHFFSLMYPYTQRQPALAPNEYRLAA
jgi:hypothetical protein